MVLHGFWRQNTDTIFCVSDCPIKQNIRMNINDFIRVSSFCDGIYFTKMLTGKRYLDSYIIC